MGRREDVARNLREAARLRFLGRYAMPASLRPQFKYLARGAVSLARSHRSLCLQVLP